MRRRGGRQRVEAARDDPAVGRLHGAHGHEVHARVDGVDEAGKRHRLT